MNKTLPANYVSSPPLWRTQTVRVLQLIGIIAAFLGGADFMQLMSIVPPDVAAWLIVAGPAFAAGAKPLILMIGDYMDDGVKNDSFKIRSILLPFLLCSVILTLPSCVSTTITTTALDGTVTVTKTQGIDQTSVASAAAVASAIVTAKYSVDQTPIHPTK